MYRLEYQEPCKYDDDFSGRGLEIRYDVKSVVIKADTDKKARAAARAFLKKGKFRIASKVYKRHGHCLIWIEMRELMNIDDFLR